MNTKQYLREAYGIQFERRINQLANSLANLLFWWKR